MKRTSRWRQLSDQLDQELRNYTSAHGEQYILGGDERIDWLYESLWGMVLEAAPEYVPIEQIPGEYQEYIEQAEQDNAVLGVLEQMVEEERHYLTYRHEKPSRKRKTLTFLATPK